MKDAFAKVGIDAETDRVRRRRDLEVDPTFLRQPGTCFHGTGSDRLGVRRAAVTTRLVPRGRDERIDCPGELIGVSADQLERVLVLARLASAAECQLGLCEDAGERNAKLM